MKLPYDKNYTYIYTIRKRILNWKWTVSTCLSPLIGDWYWLARRALSGCVGEAEKDGEGDLCVGDGLSSEDGVEQKTPESSTDTDLWPRKASFQPPRIDMLLMSRPVGSSVKLEGNSWPSGGNRLPAVVVLFPLNLTAVVSILTSSFGFPLWTWSRFLVKY